MLKQNIVHNRADRISGIGRIALATPALGGAILDAPLPQVTSGIVIQLLAAYTIIALIICGVVWTRRLSAKPVGQWAHGLDLLVIAVLVYLTDGTTSPFFPLYVFAMLSATLRWDWRGALVTGIAIIVLFVPTVFIRGGGLDPQRDDILRFVVRLGQIVIACGFLTYIGLQRERFWGELLRLSQPVGIIQGSIDDTVLACLDHARDFFAAPRALFIWEWREDHGWRALQSSGTLPPSLVLIDAFKSPVDGAPQGSAFDFHAAAPDCRCYGADGVLQYVNRPLLDQGLARHLGVDEAIIASVACDALDGWLIVPRRASEDDLYLARALSVQLAAALDHAAAAQTWRAAAASEDRIRVAHDLHDGILQFLTGLALQLRLMERQIVTNPAAVSDRIRTVSASLRHEQQDLRHFLENIRPRGVPVVGGGLTLMSMLPILAEQWEIGIDAGSVAEPPAAIADEIRPIIREAVANAVRHAGAHRVDITSAATADGYALRVQDNGRGFAQPGRFTADELTSAGAGPRSILDRVSRLGGSLTLDTDAGGTTLIMTFPVQ